MYSVDDIVVELQCFEGVLAAELFFSSLDVNLKIVGITNLHAVALPSLQDACQTITKMSVANGVKTVWLGNESWIRLNCKLLLLL